MFELINLLETVYRTISADLEAWFEQFPQGLAWNVFSDYCIGDPSKANDTFAFAGCRSAITSPARCFELLPAC